MRKVYQKKVKAYRPKKGDRFYAFVKKGLRSLRLDGTEGAGVVSSFSPEICRGIPYGYIETDDCLYPFQEWEFTKA